MNFIVPNVRYQGRPSTSEMERRYTLASEAMKAAGVDCLVMQSNDYILGGYVKWFCEVQPVHVGTVMFEKDWDLTMISMAAKGGHPFDPNYFDIPFKNNIGIPNFHNAVYADTFESDELVKIIREKGHKTIGIVAENIVSAATYNNLARSLPDCKIVNFSEPIDHLIANKSPEELDKLQRAVDLHDALADCVPALIHAGRMERDVTADLYRLSANMGGDEFLNNIYFGSKESGPYMYPIKHQNRILQQGDEMLLLIEVPSIEGYYAEFTRMYSLGPADAAFHKIIEDCFTCQDEMAKICKPGISGKELFAAVNEWHAKYGYAPETRLFGHSQGYNLVERPYFDAVEEMTLQEGMFIAIHPRLKKDNKLGCVSDNYVVTKDGAKLLSRCPRKLFEV